MFCILQSQHKWLDVSNLTLSSWDTSHDTNMSSWDTSHDTNITVTLSGIQLQTCYWNITNLNLNISKSLLPEMTLTIDEKKRNHLTGFNQLSVIVYNSTVQHLIGSCINLSISEVFIIDPQESDKPVFMLKSSWVEIVASRFHGINVTGERDESAAVLYIHDCQANMKSSHFSSNSAYQGTISTDDSRMTVSNCKFQQNQGYYGGALSTTKSSVSLILSEFKRNQAPEGGAMNIQDRSELTIHNCKFQQNQAKYGGALDVLKSNVSLTSSEFKGNQAVQGGALNVQDDSTLAIKKCSFKSNKATGSNVRDAIVKLKEFRRNLLAAKSYSVIHWQGNPDLGNITHTGDGFTNTENQEDEVQADGGAIDGLTNVTITIIQSEFTGNSAAGGVGGAILVSDDSQLEVHSSLLTNNTALQGGAILGGQNATITITLSQFISNTAAGDDGAGYVGFGGAICVTINSQLEVRSSLFTNNTAFQGGAINGQQNVTITIEQTELIANTAAGDGNGQGRAIIVSHNRHAKLHGSGSDKQKTGNRNEGHPFKHVFSRSNDVAPMGGAICAGNDVMIHITNSMFINNTAADNGYGGALYVPNDVTLHIEDSVFDGNSAGQYGGAIDVEQNVTMTMKNTTLSNNQANLAGGLLAAIHIDLHIINCTFLNNSAQQVGALFNNDNSNLTVDNSLFINNTGYQATGAIGVQVPSTACIVRCNFSGNTGAYGSDIHVFQSVMNVSHVSFTNVSPNIIYLHSVQFYMSDCTIKNNSLRRPTQRNDDIFLIELSGNSNAHITGCNLMYNDFHGIGFVHLVASMFYIDKSNIMHNSLKANFKVESGILSMNNCNASFNNISSNYGLINSDNSRIFMHNSGVNNNSVEGSGIIASRTSASNISIWNSSLLFNSATGNGGVISLYTGNYSSLSVANTLFHHNHADGKGAVIHTKSSTGDVFIDIALDSCNFTGNTAQSDTALYLDGRSYLRTAMCHFGSAIDSSACTIYFLLENTNTDYVTYRTQFHTGSTSLNTSEHDFLQKAVSAGVIVVDKRGSYRNVTNEETPYAAGEHQFSSTVGKFQNLLSQPLAQIEPYMYKIKF